MNVYLILLVVLCNVICLRASRIMVSLFAIELGAPQYLIGVMIGLYALFPALLAVYAGRLSDRKGPHLPMLGGSAGAVAGTPSTVDQLTLASPDAVVSPPSQMTRAGSVTSPGRALTTATTSIAS